MKKLLLVLVTSVMSLLASTAAFAWPEKPIKIIVPYAAGGTTDIAARLVGKRLSETWKTPVIIDNRAGANTQIGTAEVARAVPDGYTFLVTAAPFIINSSLYNNLQYKAFEDFEPISLLVRNPQILAINPGFTAQNVKDLLSQAASKPGTVSVASPGNGSMGHMSIELLSSMAKVELLHVPYKGEAQAIPDVIGGQVSMIMSNPAALLPQIRSGKLKAIAVSSAKRSSALADVPTFAESGLAAYETTNWFGMLAPAKTSKEILDKMNTEVAKIMASKEVQDIFVKDGVEPVGSSREDFRKFLQTENTKWAKIVKERNIKPD
jgi:tripartite-type tricarboxylate transporter receptor subunit TctC